MTPEQQPGAPWTLLARLVRPQGRHGEILADLLTDFPDRFAERTRLSLLSSENSPSAMRDASLENHWLHKGRIVLKFAGIDSISAAEALRGLFVAIPASQRAPLTDGSIYIADLIGCEIFDLNTPQPIGIITDVDRDAALLELKTPIGEQALVPFVKAWLVTMDLAAKRIEMRLPQGLLDINAPISEDERHEIEESREDER